MRDDDTGRPIAGDEFGIGDRDPSRDPQLAHALNAMSPVPPVSEDEWQLLRTRIVHGAAAVAAGVTPRPAWWEVTARWSSAIVPLAAAAGLVASLALRNVVSGTPQRRDALTVEDPMMERDTLLDALFHVVPDREFVDLATAPLDDAVGVAR